MKSNYTGEKWLPVDINLGQTSENQIEVSNFGRVRSFNKISDGNILKGSFVNGYHIIRLKFFVNRNELSEKALSTHKKRIIKQENKIKVLKEEKADKAIIKEEINLLQKLKNSYIKSQQKDWKERAINYHSLVHRLVATYFVKKPSELHTVVAHLDYDKLNNRASNLKWMTPAQNVEHQRNSPYVIAELAKRKGSAQEVSRNSKLTVTKVMLLKKLLNNGKDIKALVKQFKVSDTQILRIKRGENWGDVPAAN